MTVKEASERVFFPEPFAVLAYQILLPRGAPVGTFLSDSILGLPVKVLSISKTSLCHPH